MTTSLKDWIRGDTKVYSFSFKDKKRVAVPLFGKKLIISLKLDLSLPDNATGGVYIFQHSFPDDTDSLNGKAFIEIGSDFTKNILADTYNLTFKFLDPTVSPAVSKTFVYTTIRVFERGSEALT